MGFVKLSLDKAPEVDRVWRDRLEIAPWCRTYEALTDRETRGARTI